MRKISFSGSLILLAFPLIFLISQLFMKYNYRYFYISDFDPVYAFLFNGLNLSRGILGTGLAGFPGTTMQIYLAGIIHLGNLFSGNHLVTDDVLINPEYYLNLASIGLVLMSTTILIFTGVLLYRKTGRYDIALFLQLTSFISVFGFCYSTLIMCEPFMLIAVQIIILQLALSYFSENKNITKNQLLLTGFASGFGLVTKISFAPVLLLPFLLAKGVSQKIKYLTVTLFTAGILAIPLYPDISGFIRWVKMIFLHSGLYGGGESKIIDPGIYLENLKEIILRNPFITAFFAGLGIYFICRIIPSFRSRINAKDHFYLRSFAIVITILLLELSKHYRPYYTGFFYGLCLFPGAILTKAFKNVSSKYVRPGKNNSFSTILVCIFGFALLLRLYSELKFSVNMRYLYTKSVSNIQSIVGDSQRIIINHSGSSAFKELALDFGKKYSTEQRDFYSAKLNRLYPNTYFYLPGRDRLFNWNSEFSLPDILSDDTVIYVVSRQRMDTIPERLYKNINQLKKQGLAGRPLTVYKNGLTHDYVMKITGDKAKLNKYFSDGVSIFCSCEFISSDAKNFISSDQKYLFDKAFMRTDENKFSGKYSVKANENTPYAMDVKIPVIKNSYIKAMVWRHTHDGKGLIVADNRTNNLYEAGCSIIKHENSWDLINLNVAVPDNFRDDTIHFYLWYNGKDSCYFDDFRITEYPGF